MNRKEPRFFPSGRLLFFLALFLILAKVVYSVAYRADSDETQHLHVVWGWANGLLPYRDLFDNHSPLFQALCSPLFRWLGERPDIVIPMRWAMIPLYFLSLYAVYRIGLLLYSRRLAIWAALLTGAYPIFFTKSTEFRTDDLWSLFWLLALLALCRPPLTWRNALGSGLLFGAAFATSMKTSLLLACLTIAAALLLGWKAIHKMPFNWKRLPGLLFLTLIGITIIPSLVVAYFAAHGALPNLYYCVIQHNLVGGFFRFDIPKRAFIVGLPLLLSAAGGYVSVRRATEPARRDRLALIALTATVLSLLFGLYWPIIEPHDILPLAPLAFLAAVPALAGIKSGKDGPSLVLPSCVALEILALFLLTPPRPHALDETRTLISNVLSLTTPQDYVMDAKGETIYRRRAFYYVLEGVTLQRLDLGLIKDDIPERLQATRAPVATILRAPPRARQFIEQNYIPIAYRVRVLGQMLIGTDNGARRKTEFEIVIPARYGLLAEKGKVAALLDGTSMTEPRFLSPGHHQIEVSPGSGRLALVWAVALEKGYSPFSPQARDIYKGISY